ncbi:caspase Dronc [Ischnura elegans]|uniref:caspase Dronc n=1 Tax=Ischnura elegans TaxID=197161 RepID=UPI001ED8674D|nr:caspase Dronc [Ischnura elegans]XP_046389465.1 caspase Dronc [Ischnura elegans]
MNDQHRRKILENMDKLVDGADVAVLLPKLLDRGVFLKNMVIKYQRNIVFDRKLRRDFYFEILTRGPLAFQNLVSALNESGHGNLALLLEPDIKPILPSNKKVHPFRLPDYATGVSPGIVENIKDMASQNPNVIINLRTEPLNVVVKKATAAIERSPHYKTAIYPMGSRPKGYAMIINIKKYTNDIKNERHGAEEDEKNLKSLFEGLGYDVTVHTNLSGDKMTQELISFSLDTKHKHVDSCILAILCHGEQILGETHFVAADGKTIPVNRVLDLFTNEKSLYLRKKPKLFFFQSCRGDGIVHGIKEDHVRTALDGHPQAAVLRKYSDMLIAYATVKGYEAHRDYFIGTWFIQAVCEVFMTNACDTEIMEMLKMVDEKLEKLVSERSTMQTTCFENRGFKTFFFNPGIYDDEKGD